jgi:transglutaminase-like putative cysteine protease
VADRWPSGVVAVLVAGVAGQVSAAVVGILPWPVLPLAAGLLLAGARLGVRADERRAALLRRVASFVALAVVLSRLPGLATAGDPEHLKGSLGLVLVVVQVCQSVGWRAAREVRGGLLTAVGVLVLAASYAPDVLVGLPLVVGWVAVLVGVARLQGVRPAQLWPATALAVVLGLVAFLLVPAPVSAGVRSRLAGRAAGGEPATAGRGEGGAGAYSGEQIDLRRRGALSPEPLLSVPGDSPVLWRSSTFDRYDGTTWTRTGSTRDVGPGPVYRVASSTGPVRTDAVRLLAPTDGTVWAPGLVDAVEDPAPEAARVDEHQDVQLLGAGRSYVVTSEVAVTDPVRLRGRTGADDTQALWRSYPAALPDRVGDLARQLTAGAGSRWDAAEAIAGWLRTHATYRLDSPVPPAGTDAVDRFLFVDRTGFCEQFASAEAVLLRTVGIPARLVTGLAYGTPDGDRRTYRGSDLHAWVELWVPGAGWVTSDPTAGVPLAGGAGHVPLRRRLSAALTSGLRALTDLPGGKPALALGLLAASALVALAVPRRPRRRRPTAAVPATAGPALAAFLRLDERLGARRRRPGESLRELGRRLDPGLAGALEVVEQECYAPVPPDPRAAVELLERS